MTQSQEDYLKTLLLLQRKKACVHAADLARQMGYSKPSVSVAIAALCRAGAVMHGEDGELYLTQQGRAVAEAVYTRFCFFREQLLAAGVLPARAEQEACRMEHSISAESFAKLCRAVKTEKQGDRIA